jgi:hypothetical protein
LPCVLNAPSPRPHTFITFLNSVQIYIQPNPWCRTKIEISLSRHNFHFIQKLLNSYSLGRFPQEYGKPHPASQPLFCWVVMGELPGPILNPIEWPVVLLGGNGFFLGLFQSITSLPHHHIHLTTSAVNSTRVTSEADCS